MSSGKLTSGAPAAKLPHPDSERRSALGWILMIAMFIVCIVSANAPKPAKPTTSVAATLFKQDFLLRMEVLRNAPGRATLKAYNRLLSPLYIDKDSDARVARMALVIGKEAGKRVDRTAMATVAKDDSELSKACVQVYGAAKVTLEDAKRIQAIPATTFSDKLMAIHAFEKAGDPSVRNKLALAWKAGLASWWIGAFAGIVGIGVVLAYIVFGGTKAIKPRGFPIGEVTGAVADRMAMRMGIYLAIYTGVQMGVAALAKPAIGVSGATVLGWVLTFAAVVAMLHIPVLGVADSYKQMIGDTKHWLRLVGVGLLACCANVPLVMIATAAAAMLFPHWLSPPGDLREVVQNAHSPLGVALVYASAAIVVPLFQELTYRGMLFPALSRVLKSPTLGVLLAGLLFAVVHPSGPQSWAAFMVFGCTGCIVTRLTGSLIPAMVAYAAFFGATNTISLLLLR